MQLVWTLAGIVSWIHNYLAERRQFVVFNGVSSETTPVVSGVLQGSILGPLLFLIYIDDISKVNLSSGSKLVLYTDDIAPSPLLMAIVLFKLTLIC